MSISYTPEQVLALAPDAASGSAGKALAHARKWQNIGTRGNALWGECQGSGKDPYRLRVDLSEPAFKCSCPSRKFPCKHGLGLLLLFAENRSAFPDAAPPDWVVEWLATREERAAKKQERAEEKATKEADPEARAKRAEKREGRVEAGIADLDLWIRDLVRRGFGSLPAEPYSFWDTMARRMVDAQASGLAQYVREIPGICSSGSGWQERLLRHVGRLHLLLRAWEAEERLPEPLREDVRTLIGFPRSHEEVLQGETVSDLWGVWAQYTEEIEDGLRVQRSFLIGKETKRCALLVAFAPRGATMEITCAAGTAFPAELAFFPSAAPLRALIKTRTGDNAPLAPWGVHRDIGAYLQERAGAMAANPWIEKWPGAFAGVRFAFSDGAPVLVDSTGQALPVAMDEAARWKALAHSGGRPALVFAEGTDTNLHPLSLWCGGRYVALRT